jgi:hypothetical protein
MSFTAISSQTDFFPFSAPIGPPPSPETLEITVFGPGFGESIILHIPAVGWGVVDSCLLKRNEKAVNLPLNYLRAMGVSSLAFVILSHPHQDHFEGLDEILESLPCSMVGRYGGDSVRELQKYWIYSDVDSTESISDSLARVFVAFEKATDNGATYKRLNEMSILYDLDTTVGGRNCLVKLLSLSPSGLSQERYANILRSSLKMGKPLEHLKRADHNLIASALWLQVNNTRVLLGSDVEKGVHPQTGWKGIVRIPGCPDLRVSAIKVAHHGSSGAHHQPAWNLHKEGFPVALLTPYSLGAKQLPKHSDIQRIRENCSSTGITGGFTFESPQTRYGRSSIRQASMTLKNWNIRVPPSHAGVLRVRYDLQGNRVELLSIPPANWVT